MTLLRGGFPKMRDRFGAATFNIQTAAQAVKGGFLKKLNEMLFMFYEGIGYSEDGVAFLPTCDVESGPYLDYLLDMDSDGSRYVAVGQDGIVWVSDGPPESGFDWGWEELDLVPDGYPEFTGYIYGVKYYDGWWYFMCDGALIRWDGDLGDPTTEMLIDDSDIMFLRMDAGNDALVVVGSDTSTDTPVIYKSATGAEGTWSAQSYPTIEETCTSFTDVQFTGDIFLIIGLPGSEGTITPPLLKSTDGEAWTDISSKFVTPTRWDMAFELASGVTEPFASQMLLSAGKVFVTFTLGDLQCADLLGEDVGDFVRLPLTYIAQSGLNVEPVSNLVEFKGNYYALMANALAFVTSGFVVPEPPPPAP